MDVVKEKLDSLKSHDIASVQRVIANNVGWGFYPNSTPNSINRKAGAAC